MITIEAVTISAIPSKIPLKLIFKRIRNVRQNAQAAASTIKNLDNRSLNVTIRFINMLRILT
jgi:hypothetical protein